jgi:hypothetical protein
MENFQRILQPLKAEKLRARFQSVNISAIHASKVKDYTALVVN